MGGLLAGLSLFVLVNKQPDTLSKFVPADSEFYFHGKSAALKGVDAALRDKFAALFALNKNLLAKLQSVNSPETGLFYKNGGYSIITREDSKNLKAQSQDYISAKRKFLDFSDFQLYSEKIPDILANFTPPQQGEINVIYGKISKSKICLKSGAPKILTTNPAFIDATGFNGTAYANGLILNNNLTTQNGAPTNYPNMPALFLSKLLGKLEVALSENNDFIIGFDTKTNPDLKVKQTLAHYFPRKQAKTLPDGTISYNLIADPSVFEQTPVEYNGKNIIQLKNDNAARLFMFKQERNTFISNKKELLNFVKTTKITGQPSFDIIQNDVHVHGTQNFWGQLRVCID